jgi:hypothetical protein
MNLNQVTVTMPDLDDGWSFYCGLPNIRVNIGGAEKPEKIPFAEIWCDRLRPFLVGLSASRRTGKPPLQSEFVRH